MSDTTELERVKKAQREADKVLERISKGRTKLVARLPFFGHLALKLRPRITDGAYDGVSTAAVSSDGSLIVNAEFSKTLSDPELCFVICHEVLHPAMLYFERMQGRIPRLWNMAHDYAINLIIKQMADANIKLIPDCLCDDKYRDWSAEEIYDDLLKDAVMVSIAQGCPTCDGTGQQNGQGQPGQGQPGQGGQGGQQPGQGQGGQGQSCPTCKGSGQGQGGQGGQSQNPLNDPLFGDGRNDLCDSDDGKKGEQGDKGAQNRINTDWKISIVEAAQRHERQKGRGSLPGSLQRLIEELTDPKVDWREKLARWVGENGRQQDYSYRRPSRRSESVGQYMPSLQQYGIDDIVLMIDTSGSIGDRMLKEGLAEVNGVCEDLGISCRAMIIDAALHDDCQISDAYELAEKLSGGGGSDFRPAFDKLRDDQFEGVVIAFTDGDIAVPYDKPTGIKGVLWVLYEGCTPPTEVYGETVMIPKE